MTQNSTVSLITTTWSGDLDHYRVLLSSLAKKQLSATRHITIVQSEDFKLFKRLFSEASDAEVTLLLTTGQVLPSIVEHKRLQARDYQKLFGPHITRLSGSMTRVLGWPNWSRYTGWHIQQISKLAMAAQVETDYALVIDSDVIVTPAADLTALLSKDGIVCFSSFKPLSQFEGKTRNWVLQAGALLQVASSNNRMYNSYFDTPFLIHVSTLKAMLGWLESTYQLPWWRVLLQQPPRHWSEFATYQLFLLKRSVEQPERVVTWLSPDMMHYIFDANGSEKLLSELRESWLDPSIHFITVHSQSSSRKPGQVGKAVIDFFAEIE